MVSFRFHLVSLVAVFLALGLGVLTGTTVLNRGIVTQLENNTNQLVETAGRLREEVRDLQRDVDVWQRFGSEVGTHLIEDRLVTQDAVLITQEGTDNAAIDRVRRGLETAGAEVRAVLSVDRRMAMAEAGDAQELARVLESEETDPNDLGEEAAAMLAARLTTGARGPDLLDRLLGSGFLLNRGPGLGLAALRDIGGPTQLVVIVAGGTTPPLIEPDRFLVPLVDELAGGGGLVSAGEGSTSMYPFVELLRSDTTLSRLVVTQDNVDELTGEVGLILALEDLVEDRRVGHYGVKGGVDGLIPALP
ncbi:MAG TPA: copper transporter [Actinomycetota bacterium]|nr:copper transporter [Actinomycetota bacterium]